MTAESPSAVDPPEAQDILEIDGDAYMKDARFSRVAQLPADPSQGRDKPFTIKYADFGYRNEDHPHEESVLLNFGPMLGSRLLLICLDKLAKDRKVRIINPDRFGFGGTDNVDTSMRLNIWRGVMISLLKHLNIQHVSVACNSGGAIYALDFVFHYPAILHPEHPYLAIGSPWVLPSHTGVTSLAVAKALPSGIIAQINRLAPFLNNTFGPAVDNCVSFGRTLSGSFSFGVSANASSSRVPEGIQSDESRLENALKSRIIDAAFSEGTDGLSGEALLLLQSIAGQTGWGDWTDIDVLAPRLTEVLRAADRKLNLDVYFAANDSMIGDAGSKGPLWFDRCWTKEAESGIIQYSSKTVPETDHEGIWLIKWGAIQQVLDKIGTPTLPDD